MDILALVEEPEGGALLTYQVCADQVEGFSYDGTGSSFTDVDEALTELRKARRRHPQAYLATVTYQRCDENQFTGLSQQVCVAVGVNTKVH
jgi:hypothetical protein